MPEPLTVISAYGTAGNFDGEAVGFLAVTATGAGLAADTMEFVSDVVAHEIDIADAADYLRTTAVGAVSTVGDDQVLGPAPAETPTFDLAGAPSVGGFWLYDPTTGVDATMAVIGFLPQTAAAGLAVHTVNAPDGWVKWRKQPIDLEQRVTSLEDRTVPDAADGDPNQVWTTDGAAGSWQDVPGGADPVEAVAYEYATGVWIVDVDDIDGRTYVVPDYATDDDHQIVIKAPGGAGPGSFRVVIRPQTGDGLMSGGVLIADAIGGTAFTHTEIGNSSQTDLSPMPVDLSGGAILDWSNDGNGWVVASPLTDYTTEFAEQSITNISAAEREVMYAGTAHDGGGTVDILDDTRVGDTAGWYIPTDQDILMADGRMFSSLSGTVMIVVRNQLGAPCGFYSTGEVNVDTLNGTLITDAPFASPKPTTGQRVLGEALVIDGKWHPDDIKPGMLVVVDALDEVWKTITGSVTTDFAVVGTRAANVTYGASTVEAALDDLIVPPVAALTPTTGTVDLDLATVNGEYRTHALSGNVTYTSSNRAAGKSVTIKVLCDGTPRTFTFPAWVFVGTEPTGIAAGKTGILTVTWFGTADTDAVAAWSVEA